MTYIPTDLRALVISRARESCEYCLVHTDYAVLVHEIDHVIAEKHGGPTETDNLAYACAQCRRQKWVKIVGENCTCRATAQGIVAHVV
jgi:5-methylcytosine-specific restriction endonuclease McrA